MHDGGFPVEMVNGVPVVAAPDAIDVTNTAEFRSALLKAAGLGHGTLVANLTGTQFCDASGLRALLAAHEQARTDGGEMLLVTRSAKVHRVLAITCTDRVISHCASLEEALERMSANRSNGRRRGNDRPEGQDSPSGLDVEAS
jgi:anti-anti-sigma factor